MQGQHHCAPAPVGGRRSVAGRRPGVQRWTVWLLAGLLWVGGLCGGEAAQLAYVGNTDKCDNLYLIDSAGGDRKQLTQYAAGTGKRVEIAQMAWSPDGSKIAYVLVENMTRSLAVVNVADAKVTTLYKPKGFSDEVEGATWSADSKRVAFVAGETFKKDLYTVGVDGAGLKQLTKLGQALMAPVWSPDGKRLALPIRPAQAMKDGTNYLSPLLHVIQADGSGLKRVSPAEGSTKYFAWSPDGAKLVLVHLPIKEQQGNVTVLGEPVMQTVNADGSNLQKLTHEDKHYDAEPSWSPDGRQLVFTSNREGGSMSIYVANQDGGEVKCLTDKAWGQEQGAGSFSPKGDRIAYVQKENTWTGHLHVMKTDGSEDRELATKIKHFAWRPKP